MRILLIQAFFLFVGHTLIGQSGSIFGKVLSQEGEPIEFATVSIEGLSIGEETDVQGQFQIRDLTLGEYTVKVSFIGYEDRLRDRPNRR